MKFTHDSFYGWLCGSESIIVNQQFNITIKYEIMYIKLLTLIYNIVASYNFNLIYNEVQQCQIFKTCRVY